MINNPFAANPLKNIQTKMTRKQFDAFEQKDEWVLDYDRDADCNENYTLYVHKDRYEGLLVIEKEKL